MYNRIMAMAMSLHHYTDVHKAETLKLIEIINLISLEIHSDRNYFMHLFESLDIDLMTTTTSTYLKLLGKDIANYFSKAPICLIKSVFELYFLTLRTKEEYLDCWQLLEGA